jgi:Na+/H+ antiporter NhaD/arsenite permease-like protein
MRTRNRVGLVALVLLISFLLIRTALARGSVETTDEVTLTLIGQVVNTGGEPIPEAAVGVLLGNQECPILCEGRLVDAVHTGGDGLFVADVALSTTQMAGIETGQTQLTIVATKASYRQTQAVIAANDLYWEGTQAFVRLPDIALANLFNAAFHIATITFVAVFALIAFHVLHDTLAAFLGATVMLGITYTVGTFNSDFRILSFERAIEFIDFDVIFLIMTLMILVAVIGRTGVFQWLALAAYRAAHGSAWRLAVILMAATAVLSAFLNNVTIMLLMAPVTIEVALILGINPAALIIPEVLASNIGGTATLIGDPPNTVIGSFADLGFNQFLIHMGPIALIGTITLIAVIYVIYRREYAAARKAPSPALLARLEKDAQITDPLTLKRSLLVVGAMMVLFFISEQLGMPPSVVGFIGATALLVWVRPNVEQMLSKVDWTTLVFFISLFMVVGGVQEVGLIQWIADLIAGAAGTDLFVASQSVIWLSAVASAIVNNIPFTTAALPIAAFLTRMVPGAGNNVLYWSLSLGANMGGNATYIGSAPNVVAIGILDRAGYRVTFVDWLKVGIPVTFATVLVPTIWLWIRYFWLKF